MNWELEIIELHRFFEAWFVGREDSLERAELALHLDFTCIGPDGVLADRSTTLQRLRNGHAHTTSLSIETRAHRLLHTADKLLIASYIERHELSDDRTNERISTAVLVPARRGPNGLRWLHVQETWLEHS